MHRPGLLRSTAGGFRIVICLLIGLMQWLGLESAWPSELNSPASSRAATDTFQRQSPPLPRGMLDAMTPPVKTPSDSAALTNTLLSSALGLNIGNLMKSLPGGAHASLPGVDVSELVNKARAVQLASAGQMAGLGALRSATSAAPVAARGATPTASGAAAPRATLTAFAAQAQASPSANPLLASTPDANTTDPFIVQKAADLGNDPAQIFAFVRDQIGYESYKGSLRGARGTLWSKAGNSLDKASLLVALLRASNIPAQYVQGTLSDALSKQLILSMFPSPLRVVGCLDPGTQAADPANDPTLLAETEEHFWVQFGTGSLQDADPTFPSAQVGQTFTTALGTFTEVPDSLRHKVRVRLNRELTFPKSLLGGPAQDLATVLDVTVNTVEVVGKPLSVGHFVSSNTLSAPIFSSVTNTYSPYLILAGDSLDPTQDQLVPGQDYQETLTNFPFASAILTGVFLDLDVIAPDGITRSYERALGDRIGTAARRNGGGSSLTVDANTPTLISPVDITTISILPGKYDRGALAAAVPDANTIASSLAAFSAQAAGSTGLSSAAQEALAQQGATLLRNTFVAIARARLALFQAVSDEYAALFAGDSQVAAYFDSPRIDLYRTRAEVGADNSLSLFLSLDLRKNDIRALPFPGQNVAASVAFKMTRGFTDTSLETAVVGQAAQLGTAQVSTALSAQTIFSAAQAQGTGFTVLTPANNGQLDALNISADAKVLIGDALARGELVVVPSGSVTVNGQQRVGWYESDASGETIGVLDDGGHQGIIEQVSSFLSWASNSSGVLFFLGVLAGLGVFPVFEFLKDQLLEIVAATLPQPLRNNSHFLKAVILGLFLAHVGIVMVTLETEFPLLFSGPFGAGFAVGFLFAFSLVINRLKAEPPLVNLLLSPPIPAQYGSLAGSGVATEIIPDPEFTFPVGGAQVPAFRIGIQNLTSTTETFVLTLANPPVGFTAQTSVPQITIPPGETGEVGICLRPVSGLGAPGTQTSFSLQVTSTSNPTITGQAGETFTVPAIQAVTLSALPPSLSSTPGTGANTTLTLQSVGNVQTPVTLTAALDSSISLTGLPSSVTVESGQTSTQPLTITPDLGAPLAVPLNATITATFGDPANPQTTSIAVGLTVLAAQAQGASAGAQDAAALGRSDIAINLSNLATAITALAANPSNAADEAAVLAYVDNLILEMNAPFLAGFAAQLQTVRDAIASSTAANVTDALNQLATVLSSLDTVLSSPAAFPFDLSLAPNSALALPGQPASFKVLLQNNSTATNTYDLSLGPLPSGITGALNVSSVTLAPGANTLATSPGNPVVTLTEATSSIVPAQFTVTASIEGLSGSARSTTGTLTVENEFLAVTSVEASPGIVNSGDSTDVTAQLANVVNEPKMVNVSLAVKNATGTVVLTPPDQSVQLSIQSLVTTVDFGQISTQGLANGDYTLLVTVADPVTGQPLPGGTGTGTLLVGLPVSATLSVSPTVLPPGNGTVTTTLTVNGPGSIVTGSPFSLLGNVATASPGESLAVNGTLAYVCDDNEISVTDVTDPAHPVLLGTAASTSLKNDGLVHCSIRSGKLVAFADANSSLVGNNPVFLYFDLSNPTEPSFVHATSISKRFFAEPVYIGNTAFVPTTAVFFFPGDGIIDQRGDLVAVDLTDLNNPLVLGTLEQGQPNFDATFGGHHPVFGAAMLDSQTLLVGTTSASGGGSTLNTGVGQLLVVDVSNPAAMSIVQTVNVPGTVHLYKPIIQGNLAIAIGAAGGYHVPCCAPDNGPIVAATFDITDPRNPVLLATLTTDLNPAAGGGLAAIGNNLFLFAGIQNSTNQLVLLEVDTTDPGNPAIQTFSIPTQVNRMVPVGTVLYTVGPNGLTTYSIPGVSGTQYSATVEIDNTGTAVYDPTSFSVAPTSITSGTGVDTVKWLNPGGSTITWRSNVTGIEPGQVVPVAEGGTVSFKTALGSGGITLPQVSVTSDQILGLNPATQTVEPGQLAPFVVTVKNPMAAPVTYTLAVEGVSPGWATLQGSVTVPASGQVSVPLGLRSELGAAAGSYGFVVTASAPGGAQGSVEGTLTLQGTANIGQPVSTTARGVSVALVPAQGTAGQDTTATFGVQITNAGNTTDSYNLSASLPPGVSSVFDQTSVQVPPGLSNFRQVNLHLTPSPGTAPGSQAFTVTAVSATDSGVQGQASGTLTVAANGVSVGLAPASAGPGSTFQMTVTNIGQVPDTFDLSVGGPAAAVASLGSTAVTLGPGASQVVPINVGTITFADPGSLALTAIATSHTNTAVKASATAAVSIGATTGMTAEFSPATVNLPSPGAATLLLLVHNTGNSEDAYTGVISGTTGPISAALTGLDGQPTQTIPTFRLPGLSTGAIALNANLSAPGEGTVTVRVTSLTNGAITSAPSALVQTPTAIAVITTQASTNATNVALGTSVSDTATVSPAGAGPTPTGTVTFFLCSPSQVTSAGCPAPAGTQVGGAKTLDASGVTTSDATTSTSAPGRYCWRAEYSGDGQYAGASHTDTTQECFTVVGPSLAIQKTPKGGPYALGDTITFAIVVTNNGPGTATAVTLDDLLPGEPADLNWSISQQPAQGSCTVSGAQGNQTLHCTFGNVAEKGSVTVAVASATGGTDAADCLPPPGIVNVRAVTSGPGTGAFGAVACATNAANAASGTTPAGCVADTGTLFCGCPDANPLLGIAAACAVLQGGSIARHPSQLQISGPPGGVEGNLCIGPGSQLHASGTSPLFDGAVLRSGGAGSLPAATCSSSNPNIACPTATSDLSAQIQACAIAASYAGVQQCTMGTDYSQSLTAIASGSRNNLTISGSGDEVLCVSDVTLTGQTLLELTGLPGTTFVINVKAGGTFSVTGKSQIKVDGTNVTTDHVLYNVMGAGHSVQLTGQSEIDGSLIAADRDVQLSAPSIVNGTVCGGQDIQLTGGVMICPQ